MPLDFSHGDTLVEEKPDFSKGDTLVETKPDFSMGDTPVRNQPIAQSDGGYLPDTPIATDPPLKQLSPFAPLGMALKYVGGVAKGLVQDVADSFHRYDPATETFDTTNDHPLENIKAALRGKPTPMDAQLKDVGGVPGAMAKVSTTLSEMLPSVVASGGVSKVIQGAGVKPLLANSAASGLVFGLTPEGYDPKQGAIMALFPAVSEFGGKATLGALGKLGASFESPTAQQAIKTVGGLAASEAYMDALSLPEYAKMTPEQRKQKFAENFGVNLSMHLAQVPGLVKSGIDESAIRDAVKMDPHITALLETMPSSEASKNNEVVSPMTAQPPPAGTSPKVEDYVGEPMEKIVSAEELNKPASTPQAQAVATPQNLAEQWILEQQKKAAETPLGKTSPDAALKVVSEWIRKGETPEGEIPKPTMDVLMQSLKPTKDMETGETLDVSHPEWPRTGTLLNFLDEQQQNRLPNHESTQEQMQLLEGGQNGDPNYSAGNGSSQPVRQDSSKPLEIESLDPAKARNPERTRELQQYAAELAHQSSEHAATLPRTEDGYIDFKKATDAQLDKLFDLSTKLADARQAIAGEFDKSGIKYHPHSEFIKRIAKLDSSGEPSGGNLQETSSEQGHTGMGGATPDEFDKTTHISELTDIMSRHVSPKTPLSERFNIAQRIADRYLRDKNSLIRGIGRATARARTWYDALTRLPEWTDFKSSLGKLLGNYQRNDHELRKWVQEAKSKIPNKLRREAITNYIQAGGDMTLLRARAERSSPPFKRGYEMALELTPEEKVLAGNIGQFLDARLREGMEAGILHSGVENYVSQVWHRANPVSNKLMADIAMGKLNTNFRFAKERIFRSYFEGEMAGYEPRSKDIAALLAVYDAAWNRSIAARIFVKELNEGIASDMRPLVAVSGAPTAARDASGTPSALLIQPKVTPKDAWDYKSLNHPALRGWKWAGTDEHGNPVMFQGDLLVHPEIFTHLNRVLKTSELRQNEILKAVLDTQHFIKQTKLSLSAFHYAQEGLHAIAHRVNPFNPEFVDFNDPLTHELATHGLQLADYRAMEAFSEGVSGHGGLAEKIPVLGRLSQKLNDFLFRDYIPALKNTMAKDAFARNMERYKNELNRGVINRDQILELTANQANAAFGELNYKMIGRAPALNDFFRLTLLAPDFLESRARFVGQALKPYGAEQRAALAVMASLIYVGSRILNKTLDDDYHWDKPFSVYYGGREYSVRSVLGDIVHLGTSPRSFAFGRLSFLSHVAAEFLSGRDGNGIKRSSIEQFQDALKWLIPITLDRKEGENWKDRALSNLGVTSRSDSPQTEVYRLAADFNRNSKNALASQQMRRDVETYAKSDYAPLRYALERNDDGAAQKAYAELQRKGHTTAAIDKYFAQISKPFTGNAKQEVFFVNSLNSRQMKLYQEAIQERVELNNRYRNFVSGNSLK